MAYTRNAWLANKLSLEIRSQYSEARSLRQQPQKLRYSRKDPGRNLVERLDDDLTMAKYSGRPFAVVRLPKRSQTAFFIEDSNGVFLKDQDGVLNK